MIVERQLMPGDPPWLAAAFAEIGVREVAPGDSTRIVEYHQRTNLGATNDETPWCSSYCCFVMENAGLTSTQSAASLSWLRWGRVLHVPVRGAIVIFERTDKHGEVVPHRGHCGFWLGESDGKVWVLGGNQKNRVSVDTYSRSQVLGYRWPSSPVNSTTNMATVGAVGGTVATVTPTVMGLMSTAKETASTVVVASEKASGFWDRVFENPSSLLAMAGVCITLGALWHIMRERNKKIKRLGV